MKTTTLRAGLCLLMAVGMQATATGSDRYNCIEITFPGYVGTVPATNFPALIRLDENIAGFTYATAQAEGKDILFTDTAGNVLPHEIDEWNPAGTSLVWVLVPELSTATVIYMYHGNPAVTDAPAYTTDGSTWSAGSYYGVWHFNEADVEEISADASGNGLTGYNHSNTLSRSDGAIGVCRQISDAAATVNDKAGVFIPSFAEAQLGGCFTMSGWMRYKGGQATGYDRLISRKTSSSSAAGWETQLSPTSSTQFTMRASGGSSVIGTVPDLQTPQWIHLSLLFNDTKGNIYTNGILSKSGDITAVTDHSVQLAIGNNANTNEASFKGSVDEIRIRSIVSSADWIKAEYDTVMNPDFTARTSVVPTDTTSPQILSLTAHSLTPFTATIDANLLQLGMDAPEAYIDFGLATDALDQVRTIGTVSAIGPFSTLLDNLEPATTYYYRHRVENSVAITTAPVIQQFTTPGQPMLGAPAASNVQNTAYFYVPVTADGVTATTVRLFTGASPDALTETNVWNNVSAGEMLEYAEPFLVYGDTYYYAFTIECTYDSRLLFFATETNSILIQGAATWTSAGSDSNWSTAGNWDIAFVPNQDIDTLFVTGGETVTFVADALCKNMLANSGGAATFDLGTCTLTTASLSIGTNTSANAVSISNGMLLTGPLLIGLNNRGLNNTLELNQGAHLTASAFTNGYRASGNRLIIDDGTSVTITGPVLSGQGLKGDDTSGHHNSIYVATGGVLTVDGIYPYPDHNDIIIDGGVATNNGTYQTRTNNGRPASTLYIQNGGYLKQKGLAMCSWYNSTIAILNGGLMEADTTVRVGHGSDQGTNAMLIVSNATLRGTTIQAPSDSRHSRSRVLVSEDVEQSTLVELTGNIEVGGMNDTGRNMGHSNAYLQDGGEVHCGGSFLVGGPLSNKTNNLVSIKGKTSHITATNLTIQMASLLEFAIPNGGFDNVPFDISGTATIDASTKLTIDVTDTKSGYYTLVKASELASAIPPENITLIGIRSRPWSVIQKNNILQLQIPPPLTLLIN